MIDDDDSADVEDIGMTAKEVAKIEKKKAENAKKNPSNTFPIACPDCGCDYFIPIMKGLFTKSFAGNRISIEWPTREGTNDMAVMACPNCKIVYRVNTDGTFQKTESIWTK